MNLELFPEASEEAEVIPIQDGYLSFYPRLFSSGESDTRLAERSWEHNPNAAVGWGAPAASEGWTSSPAFKKHAPTTHVTFHEQSSDMSQPARMAACKRLSFAKSGPQPNRSNLCLIRSTEFVWPARYPTMFLAKLWVEKQRCHSCLDRAWLRCAASRCCWPMNSNQ